MSTIRKPNHALEMEEAMPRAKQLKVWVDDRPGVLAEIAKALADKKVNLRAVNAWVQDGQGVVRMVVDKHAAAKKTLASGGWKTEESEAIEITLADKPGALARAAKKLGDAGINIEYVYVGSAGGANKVNAYLGVMDVKAALKALR
jgi:hypothetical protein